MGSVLHGSARTTPRIRAELQAAQESSRALAARYGLNPKTVRKWRKRTTTADAPMGPKAPKSTLLKLRFIALHMTIERISPEEPSNAPAMMSSVLSKTKPMATADNPA